MSYWVYTDLFEEPGPPPTPFHGGFGLMTREGIRKPAWFAYKYLHALQGNALPSSDAQVWASAEGNSVAAVVWDFQQPVQTVSNKPFYSRLVPNAPAAPVDLSVAGLKPGVYSLEIRRTGFRRNDAYSAYIDMKAPDSLTPAQLAQLQSLTVDTPEVRKVTVGGNGKAAVKLPMSSNDIVLVTLKPV
jgi:xylan 1,4-beta-xylosidase